MSIEAMRQALEAMEDHAKQYPHMQKGYTVDAITALRQAIEQAEQVPICAHGVSKIKCDFCKQAEQQEPTAWVSPSWLDLKTRTWARKSFSSKPIAGWIPLYTR